MGPGMARFYDKQHARLGRLAYFIVLFTALLEVVRLYLSSDAALVVVSLSFGATGTVAGFPPS